MLAAALAVSLAGPLPAATSAPAAPVGLTARADTAAARTATVTLVTGDTVTVTTAADGGTSYDAEPAPGTDTTFHTESTPAGDTYVIPDGAGTGLAEGRLDRELFNVTRLVADGRDDDARATLPLIVDYAAGAARSALTARAAAQPGVEHHTALPSLGATAVTVDKTDVRAFYRSVMNGPKAVLHPDRKLHATLDVSVPQIGAPEVWKSGYRGDGVKVAVLDTGIDLAHPDLADRVAGAKSFVPGQDVQDGRGHGTHVAGIVAGSGAASGGRYTGVAPGARLLVGKVLDNRGNGDESSVIAGMEWAAAQGADIISMSLGAETEESGDPISEAVDELTGSSGALFVISAGNTGPGRTTVSTPGIAARALTVGATDAQDRLADFSSRGPTVGGALKPEITAPGVNIVSARAAGTQLGPVVDTDYSAISGTSMAAPHVSGAAALLVQQHPDWGPERLKDALVSSARTGAGNDVYEQGTGRLAVDRASAAPVTATGTADFGDLRDAREPRGKDIVYTNDGDRDVTLALDLKLDRGAEVPDGAATLSAASVTVPAHGSRAVTLTVDPSRTGTGRYDGYLTATGDGLTRTTAVGWTEQPPRRTVTFTLTGRDGRAAGQTNLQILDLTPGDAQLKSVTLMGEGTWQTVLPEGHYALQSLVTTYDSGKRVVALDHFAEPEFVVDGDSSVAVDARLARPLTARIDGEDRPLERAALGTVARRTLDDGASAAIGSAKGTADSTTAYGAIPSHTTAEHGTFEFTAEHRLRDPLVRATWNGAGRTAALDLLTPDLGRRFDGTRTLTAADAGTGTDADYARTDVTGKVAVVRTNGWLVPVIAKAAEHGATAVLVVLPADAAGLVQDNGNSALPSAAVTAAQGAPLLAALADGPATVTFAARPDSRFTYTLPFHASGALPAATTATARPGQFARLVNTFHADGATRLADDVLTTWHGWEKSAFRTGARHLAPGTRTDYVYADDSSYAQTVRTSDLSDAALDEYPKEFRPGSSDARAWGRAPQHPTLPRRISCPLCRADTGASFLLAPYGDSDPGHYGTGFSTTTFAYHRDGQETTSDRLFVPQDAEYRIDQTVRRRTTALETLGTRTDTSYTFRSEAPSAGDTATGCTEVFGADHPCAVLPVIFIDYDLALDGANSVSGRRSVPLRIATHRTDGYRGGTVTSLRVEVSYDDGATWGDAAEPHVRPDGSATTVLHRAPAGAETATLRVTARDAAGNRTRQTVVRAFAIRD
ncbi:S8 family serine peptidase [Streptomyces sp. NPDC057682]|uniref:S8 family serine peptidase n=1 Tax=Streptomyces sp. NPDC057682 TaxID=3346210 RepID=UPI0036B6D4AC